MEGASPGVWLEMGVAGMVSGLAGVRGECEPVDLLVGVRERPSSRARGAFGVVRARGFAGWCAWEAIFAGSRGFMEGASPGRWLEMGVAGMD